MSGPVLAISGLTVRLPEGADRRHAIEDVSLTVGAGEIVCIVGESGSGKSVTAFSVMGLLPKGDLVPVAGSIALEGEDLLAASPARLRDLRGARMAMIFQEPMTALNPVLTVGDQIDEVLRIHTPLGAGARKAKALDIMEAMRLPEPRTLYDAYPHQLSGGQRQRIMIAAAMVLDPRLLVADEPTTALDVTTQAQILKLIKDLQRRRGTGVLFITHDFGVVRRHRRPGRRNAAGPRGGGGAGGANSARARPRLYPHAHRRRAEPRSAAADPPHRRAPRWRREASPRSMAARGGSGEGGR